MLVIPLVPSNSPTLISLLRLSAHHLALAASAPQPLKTGTLSYLSVPVPVLIPFVVTSRPTTASDTRPSNPLNLSYCASDLALLTIVRIYKLYLLFYSLTYNNNNIRLTALCPGQPRWASTRKVKPIWILLKQQTVSGNGISWAICKSAPSSSQITMPAPHHWSFLRLDALPAAQPTASKHWRQYLLTYLKKKIYIIYNIWCIISRIAHFRNLGHSRSHANAILIY